MTVLQRLQAAAVAEADLQDAMTDAFAFELEQALKLVNARIRQLLATLETANGRMVSTSASLGRALMLRRDLQRAVEAHLRPVLIDALDEPLDRLAARVLRGRSVAGQAARLAPFHLEALRAFKDLRLAELLSLEADAAATVWRAVVDGVIGVRPLVELLQDIENVLDSSAAEARTVYDTAVSSWSRQVDQLHTTGEPEELFVYVGPADRKTRPFCRQHVGKVYDRRQIDRLDNGQLPNVFLTGGGYNCRHAWKRVSRLDEELRRLYETGGRHEHIATALREVA